LDFTLYNELQVLQLSSFDIIFPTCSVHDIFLLFFHTHTS